MVCMVFTVNVHNGRRLMHYDPFVAIKNSNRTMRTYGVNVSDSVVAGSLEAAYSLNWGAQEIWGKGGGETLALL